LLSPCCPAALLICLSLVTLSLQPRDMMTWRIVKLVK
jgi:hypothetical protein